MTQRIYTDRSRIITRERCPRRRWIEFHEAGTGIVPSRTPLPLAVGGAVHAGLAVLLEGAQSMISTSPIGAFDWVVDGAHLEDDAVKIALAEFSTHRQGLALDANELAAMQPTEAAKQFQSQVIAQARELGMDPAAMGQLGADPAVAQGEFDRYLWAEQSALVEALVRAYARRRLRPLLEQFEVLEVEREGEWKLSEWRWGGSHNWVGMQCSQCGVTVQDNKTGPRCDVNYELWFMSRPDALLRERQTNELYLLSYKTTAQWDVRKARDIEHDMQGLSEGVEVERRLGEWWQVLHGADKTSPILGEISIPMQQYLHALPAPPRIHAIRYEFLLKGERWKDKELSARLGIEVRSQKSHLVRQYVAVSTPKKGDGGYSLGDVCWSWDFYRPEDDRDSMLAWQNWKSRAVWSDNPYAIGAGVKNWIDKLDASELLMSGEDSTVGLAPRELGWKSPAQAMGVTKQHPLDAVFIPPVVVYRSDDHLRDWVEQVEHTERETAEHVAEVNAASDPGERRSLLNRYFPQHRQSCEYPSTCPYARDRVGVCWGSAEMQADPLGVGGGEYVRRVPNHPAENQSLVQINK